MLFWQAYSFFLYFQVKQHDNEVAMKVLPARLSKLDTLSWRERQVNLVEGLLAGNVIDWGAQAAVKWVNVCFDSAK